MLSTNPGAWRSQMKNIRLLLLAMTTVVSACGFHLRGSEFTAAQISVDSVYVQGRGAAGPVAAGITNGLKDAGIKVTDSPKDAQYSITVQGGGFASSVLSVSPTTGKAEEYQLTFHASALIKKNGRRKPLNSQTIEVSRDYTSDDRAVLGTFNEVEELRNDLVRDAADQILRIFKATLDKNP